MAEKPTLVIGDVHGHLDRFEALLKQEGIIDTCPDCDGTGDATNIAFKPADDITGSSPMEFTPDVCVECEGDGQRRVNFDVHVVQLGDLGHFGQDASPTGDKLCYGYGADWIDEILWGNHDRAVFDQDSHAFRGYTAPGQDLKAWMNALFAEKKLKMATSAHGYLIVHAGIHDRFSGLAEELGDADAMAEFLNTLDRGKLRWLRGSAQDGQSEYQRQVEGRERFEILDAISRVRGGRADGGGVLWFDFDRERPMRGKPFNFICGHTAQHDGEPKIDRYGNINIDIGGKNEKRLAGVWLNEGEKPRLVKVEL